MSAFAGIGLVLAMWAFLSLASVGRTQPVGEAARLRIMERVRPGRHTPTGTDMRILLIVNDPPYGTEKAYNALRLAMALQKDHADVSVRVFLMADAVVSAMSGQQTPQGYYNIERMLRAVVSRGGEVALCGSCVEARGLKGASLAEGCAVGSMSQLAVWTVEADKVLTF